MKLQDPIEQNTNLARAQLSERPETKERAKKMTTDEAVLQLRGDAQFAGVVRDSYLDEDVRACGERFADSPEFAEVCRLLGGRVKGRVLDLGAGRGIASYALARGGAERVYALEPDASEVVGRGEIARLCAGLPVEMLDATGEAIPLPDESVDLIYARQVLHHTRDLPGVLRECARILKSGGAFFASREHVVDDEEQLRAFLAGHPVHRLAGGEHAFPLETYLAAIESSGLKLERVLGPWDTLVNAFPLVATRDELERLPRKVLEEQFGKAGRLASYLPGAKALVWTRIKRQRVPGRLYSFLAIKPSHA